jgi:hypothetical protein
VPRIVKTMPPMLQSREEFQIVMGYDNKLYAIGGYNNTEYDSFYITNAKQYSGCLDSIEAFDFNT